MLLFWDGGAVPSGWTCVSCSVSDPFYQVFPRGNDTYGGSGGAATHVHTSTDIIGSASGAANGESRSGTSTSAQGHAHTVSVTHGVASNLPVYRQLNIIRHNTAGEPSTIPANAIGLFDAMVPVGWTAYSAQNSYYPRGENTIGVTGGSNSHNHALAVTVGNATGTTFNSRNGGTQVTSAAAAHNHAASGNSSTVNQEPPYIEAIFGQISADGAPPDGMLAMWDDDQPANWVKQSASGGAFHQRFFKGAATYGATGGAGTHSHVDTIITTSAPGTTINARSGSSAGNDSHTHEVTVGSYSSPENLPPFRDVIIAKRVPRPDFEQASYRFFTNIDSTDVGSPLAAQDSTATVPRQGTPFRLRMLVHVSAAELVSNGKNFKLQIATRSGTCDTSFIGETYADVSPSSGDIRFFDNTTPSNGANLTGNGNDPIHGGDIIKDQTYVESNNFTNSTSAVLVGEDAMWDFALIDNSAPASTNYCFRIVESDGTTMDTYARIPEIITDDGQGHMMLLYDGVTIPVGWSCVSCASGEDFYQRYFRGNTSYGATGGAETHSHTASSSIIATVGNSIEDQPGSGVATGAHTHTFTPSISSSSNLPPYRQLKVIRADNSGVVYAPAGSIAFFDAAVPTGWTRYSVQDGNYVRGGDTVGTTGGSLTHNHTISGITSTSVGSTSARTTGSTQSSATDNHTHTVSGSTVAQNHEPPYRETILGQTASTVAVPLNIITMWDGPQPVIWTHMSSSGQPFHQNFVKPATTYGANGGGASHAPADVNITTSGPDSIATHRTGTVNASGAHTHDASLTAFSSSSNLPPYIDVIFAKLGTVNIAPDIPSNLVQIRTSDDALIGVGGWANSNEVQFQADATDADNPDSLQLCVEVEPIGTAFDNVDTQCGSAVTYLGSAVTVTVTISSLTDTTNYHWQARIKDGGGQFSSYVSFGGNTESDDDFVMDSTSPDGTVFDGTVTDVDVDYNNGALDSLSANWDVTDGGSGISLYEYSIGTTVGGTDILGWTGNGTSDSVTQSSLMLNTSSVYFFNIRTTDFADNQSLISSDGQRVAPSITFSTSPGDVTFDNLNSGNSYTSTRTATLTTSTNAYNGYVIRAFATGLLTSPNSDTVEFFDGGTYDNPAEWLTGNTGYGYTSNDTSIQGSNKFSPVTCGGGGSSPCYAPFSTTAPGDIVADHTTTVSGAPIINENFIITHRVTAIPTQQAGTYTSEVVYVVNAVY